MYFFKIFVSILLVCSIANTTQREDRRQDKQSATEGDKFHFFVTGGYRPEKNLLVQFAVSLRYKEGRFFGHRHFCGGSIISKKYILTVAHCLLDNAYETKKPETLRVVAGTQRRLLRTANTQIRTVRLVIPHPKYNKDTHENDIGILKLRNKLNLRKGFVAIIPLSFSAPKAGAKCTVVGWGSVIENGPRPDDVLNGDLSISDGLLCSVFAPEGTICAKNENDYGISACHGDSGGPVFSNNKLVALVLGGNGCGRSSSPNVLTDVYYHRDWIIENAEVVFNRSSSMLSIATLMLLLLAIMKLATNKI